ncbi:hypothetical protein D3C86_1267560 [compost metagenome]
MLYPITFRSTNPIARESGIEIMTTSEALAPSGSNVIATNKMAIRKSTPKPPKRSFTLSPWSKWFTISILEGTV